MKSVKPGNVDFLGFQKEKMVSNTWRRLWFCVITVLSHLNPRSSHLSKHSFALQLKGISLLPW